MFFVYKLYDELDYKMSISQSVIVLIFVSTCTASGCTFPSYMTGNWSDSKFYDVEFHGASVMYLSQYSISRENPTTTNLTCYLTDGQRYVLRKTEAVSANINGVDGLFYYYLCMDVTKITEYSFYYYVQANIDTNGERLVALLDTIEDNNTATFCPVTISLQQFQIMVRKGFENQVLHTCSTPLLGIFSFEMTDTLGTCNSLGYLSYSDESLSTWNRTNINACTVQLGNSKTGNVGCLMCIQSGSTYITSIINLDTTIDNTIYYKFTCLVVRTDGNNVTFSQRARICYEDQTADTLPDSSPIHPSKGGQTVAALVHLSPIGNKSALTSDCYPKSTSDSSSDYTIKDSSSDYTIIIVVVVILVLLLIIACILGYVCWKKKIKPCNRESTRKKSCIRLALTAGLGSSKKRQKSGSHTSGANLSRDIKDSGILVDTSDDEETDRSTDHSTKIVIHDKSDKVILLNENSKENDDNNDEIPSMPKDLKEKSGAIESNVHPNDSSMLLVQKQTLQSNTEEMSSAQKQNSDNKTDSTGNDVKEECTKETVLPSIQNAVNNNENLQDNTKHVSSNNSQTTGNKTKGGTKQETDLPSDQQYSQSEPEKDNITKSINQAIVPSTENKTNQIGSENTSVIQKNKAGKQSREEKNKPRIMTDTAKENNQQDKLLQSSNPTIESKPITRPPSLTKESESILQSYGNKNKTRPSTPTLRRENKIQGKVLQDNNETSNGKQQTASIVDRDITKQNKVNQKIEKDINGTTNLARPPTPSAKSSNKTKGKIDQSMPKDQSKTTNVSQTPTTTEKTQTSKPLNTDKMLPPEKKENKQNKPKSLSSDKPAKNVITSLNDNKQISTGQHIVDANGKSVQDNKTNSGNNAKTLVKTADNSKTVDNKAGNITKQPIDDIKTDENKQDNKTMIDNVEYKNKDTISPEVNNDQSSALLDKNDKTVKSVQKLPEQDLQKSSVSSNDRNKKITEEGSFDKHDFQSNDKIKRSDDKLSQNNEQKHEPKSVHPQNCTEEDSIVSEKVVGKKSLEYSKSDVQSNVIFRQTSDIQSENQTGLPNEVPQANNKTDIKENRENNTSDHIDQDSMKQKSIKTNDYHQNVTSGSNSSDKSNMNVEGKYTTNHVGDINHLSIRETEGDVRLKETVEGLFNSSRVPKSQSSGRSETNKKKVKVKVYEVDKNSPYNQHQFLFPDYMSGKKSK